MHMSVPWTEASNTDFTMADDDEDNDEDDIASREEDTHNDTLINPDISRAISPVIDIAIEDQNGKQA